LSGRKVSSRRTHDCARQSHKNAVKDATVDFAGKLSAGVSVSGDAMKRFVEVSRGGADETCRCETEQVRTQVAVKPVEEELKKTNPQLVLG
jgi:hypothetical protein